MRYFRRIRIVGAFLLFLFTLSIAFCDDKAGAPAAEKQLVFGMSTALTGPAASLGVNMRNGVLLAFAEANRSGGIHGKKLELIVKDDGYEPSRTAPNMRSLVDRKDILAIIGNVGTPTAVAAIPIAIEAKIPFFGAFTGAGVLRKTPPDRYVINYRASYTEEINAMVKALIEDCGLKTNEIAFFTQRDSYGDAGFFAGVNALRKYGDIQPKQIPHGRYERNTDIVENALADILLSEVPIKAVIMVGAYAPCAKFVKLAAELEFKPIFLNVSFVGGQPLAKELGEKVDGVIVTQVVPHFNGALPIVRQYRQALKTFAPKLSPTSGSLEGYICARIMIKALKTINGVISREKIIIALESMGQFDMHMGVPLFLNKKSHQACHSIWPTIIKGGKVLPFNWKDLKEVPNAKLKR